MDATAIIQLTTLVLQLSAKYMEIARQTGELTPEQTAAFKKRFAELTSTDAWKIMPDPKP